MKIVEIRKLNKNYQVTLDNNDKLIIDENTLVKHRLLPGQEITDLDQIKKAIKLNKIYDKAVRYALYGRSEMQMIKYLEKEGLTNTYDFIMRLRKDKLINDFKLINSLVYKRYSKAKLKQKLEHYLFNEEKINEILESYDETRALRYEFSLAIKKYQKLSYSERNPKIFRYLMSKGFPEYLVKDVMNIN